MGTFWLLEGGELVAEVLGHAEGRCRDAGAVLLEPGAQGTGEGEVLRGRPALLPGLRQRHHPLQLRLPPQPLPHQG